MTRCKQSEVFWYNPQLCDRKEEARKVQSQPFVPFIIVDKKGLSDEFCPPNWLSVDASKRRYTRGCVRSMAKLMVESDLKSIVSNLDNVIKNFPSDIEFAVFSK